MLVKDEVILTKDLVLERVTPLEIFESFCPVKFDLNGLISSPFRRDRNPSFSIRRKSGYVYFIDYGTGQRGDAFEFVKLITNATSFPEVLENIDNRMGLRLKSSNPKPISIKKSSIILPEEAEEEKLFQVKVKKYTTEELAWWNRFHLDIADLKKQSDVKVYSVDKLWINKELRYINYGLDLCFGYHFEKVDKWKIYFPLASAAKGEIKWLSNVPLQVMYGLDNIKNCKKAIVAKSFKDLAVLNKVYPCVAGAQNESLAAISDENLLYMKNNAEEIFYSADIDSAGKKASHQVTSTLGLKHLNIPDYLLKFNCKDWAEWSERDTLEAIFYFLKLKGFPV